MASASSTTRALMKKNTDGSTEGQRCANPPPAGQHRKLFPYSAFYRYDPMESSLTVACFLRSVARLLLRQQLLNGICTLDTIYNLASTKRQAVSPRPVATNAYIWSHRAFIEAAVLGMRHVCSLHNDICIAFSHLLHDFGRLGALFLQYLFWQTSKRSGLALMRGTIRGATCAVGISWKPADPATTAASIVRERERLHVPEISRQERERRLPHTVPKHRLLSRNSYLVTSKTAKRRHFGQIHTLSHTHVTERYGLCTYIASCTTVLYYIQTVVVTFVTTL